jgi:hypothetical protein
MTPAPVLSRNSLTEFAFTSIGVPDRLLLCGARGSPRALLHGLPGIGIKRIVDRA